MLGNLVTERRVALGLSRADVARQLEVSRAHISAIELNKRNPSPELLVRLTHVLSWPVSEWLDIYLSGGLPPSELCRFAESSLDRGWTTVAESGAHEALRRSRLHYDGRYNSQAYHVLGKIYVKKQDFAAAYVWFTQMLTALSHVPVSLRKAKALYNYGLIVALANSDPVGSLDYMRKAWHMFGLLDRDQEQRLCWYTLDQLMAEVSRGAGVALIPHIM